MTSLLKLRFVSTALWQTYSRGLGLSTSGAAFFGPLAPVNGTFDPKVIYDAISARFVVVTLFNGSFKHPVTGKETGLKGVIFQKQKMGLGFFLGQSETGAVTIVPDDSPGQP